MSDVKRLEGLLRRIDGRPYPAYRDLRGEWDLTSVTLSIDHTQGDPFAAPSRVRVWVQTGIGPDVCGEPVECSQASMRSTDGLSRTASWIATKSSELMPSKVIVARFRGSK